MADETTVNGGTEESKPQPTRAEARAAKKAEREAKKAAKAAAREAKKAEKEAKRNAKTGGSAASLADATGDSSAPGSGPRAGDRIRVLRGGALQMEAGTISEARADGSVKCRLSAPNFAGGEVELHAGEWEALP